MHFRSICKGVSNVPGKADKEKEDVSEKKHPESSLQWGHSLWCSTRKCWRCLHSYQGYWLWQVGLSFQGHDPAIYAVFPVTEQGEDHQSCDSSRASQVI